MTRRMQSCVDHIKTSIDVDPWAMELVERVFTEYDARFDRVLEIIDSYEDKAILYNGDMFVIAGDALWKQIKEELKEKILALKGDEE